MLQEKAKAAGTSIAFIFVDARQAFYAVMRKLVLRVVEPEHAVTSLFEQLRIPPEAVEELRGIFANGLAMDERILSATAVRDIASTCTASQFHVNFDTDDLRPSVPTASFVNGKIHQGEDQAADPCVLR